MTDTLTKAAQTLVEAIKLDRHDWEDWPGDSRKAFEALKAALAALQAQPVQEPYMWVPPERDGAFHHRHSTITAYRTPMAGWEPLYRTPVQPVQETEAGEHPLQAYAYSYRRIAKMGDGRVSAGSVAVDIERNMIPVTAPVQPVQSPPPVTLSTEQAHKIARLMSDKLAEDWSENRETHWRNHKEACIQDVLFVAQQIATLAPQPVQSPPLTEDDLTEDDLVPEAHTGLVLALDKIVECHKFNIASLPPTEVHAIAFDALVEYTASLDEPPSKQALFERKPLSETVLGQVSKRGLGAKP